MYGMQRPLSIVADTDMRRAMVDVNIGEILVPGDEQTRHGQKKRVLDGFWNTMRRAAKQIPFSEDVVAAYFCALDPQTPTRVRGILLAALAYFVLPLDALPDFLAFVGFSDDMAVLAAAIAAVRSHMTPAHYIAARQALEEPAEQ